MADDGTGSSVHIPTFEISMDDGEILKKTIYSKPTSYYGINKNKIRHQPVILKVDLNLKVENQEKVNVDVWYGSIYEFANSDV